MPGLHTVEQHDGVSMQRKFRSFNDTAVRSFEAISDVIITLKKDHPLPVGTLTPMWMLWLVLVGLGNNFRP